jgi:hypothetical protein
MAQKIKELVMVPAYCYWILCQKIHEY